MAKGEINYVASGEEHLHHLNAKPPTTVELAAIFKLGGKGFYAVNIAMLGLQSTTEQ
jgi:hypothetical protein